MIRSLVYPSLVNKFSVLRQIGLDEPKSAPFCGSGRFRCFLSLIEIANIREKATIGVNGILLFVCKITSIRRQRTTALGNRYLQVLLCSCTANSSADC